MKKIEAVVDMRKLWNLGPFVASDLKAKLVEAGMPITTVTNNAINVSRGMIYWEWREHMDELYVLWQDCTLAELAADAEKGKTT